MLRRRQMSLLAIAFFLIAAGRATAQQPAKAESNRLMIEKQAKDILKMAHPTVAFTAANYFQTTMFADGTYAQTFKFTWMNVFDEPCYRYWYFYFSRDGTINQIGDGPTNTYFPPFGVNNALLNGIKDNIREQIRTGKLNQNDPVVQLILNVPEPAGPRCCFCG
jgi:hypothetical protein